MILCTHSVIIPLFLCFHIQGIPDARDDHAVLMVRFAKEILCKFTRTARDLEVMLGPDTGDLSLRIGIHSGPVAAVSLSDAKGF